MEAARRAEPADVERLAELFASAVEEMRPLRGGVVFTTRELRPLPGAEYLAGAITDGERVVVVGTYDGVVVGYGTGSYEDLRDRFRLGRVDDLYVEPEGRGVGIGRAIMNELMTWFRDRRCGAVDGFALPGDRSTKNFFEASGFSARLLVMHTRLDR